jgi:hypothetical protein
MSLFGLNKLKPAEVSDRRKKLNQFMGKLVGKLNTGVSNATALQRVVQSFLQVSKHASGGNSGGLSPRPMGGGGSPTSPQPSSHRAQPSPNAMPQTTMTAPGAAMPHTTLAAPSGGDAMPQTTLAAPSGGNAMPQTSVAAPADPQVHTTQGSTQNESRAREEKQRESLRLKREQAAHTTRPRLPQLKIEGRLSDHPSDCEGLLNRLRTAVCQFMMTATDGGGTGLKAANATIPGGATLILTTATAEAEAAEHCCRSHLCTMLNSNLQDTSSISQQYRFVVVELVASLARRPSTVYDAKKQALEHQKGTYLRALEQYGNLDKVRFVLRLLSPQPCFVLRLLSPQPCFVLRLLSPQPCFVSLLSPQPCFVLRLLSPCFVTLVVASALLR